MAYLNLDLDYFDHPKVGRLIGQLGRGADMLPVRLWCYCGKYHAETGELIGYSPLEIETAIKWWGQPGRAVEALISLGFLDKRENGYQVHDWDKINGHIAALKARAQAGAKARWERAKKDAQAMLKHATSIATSNAPQEDGKEGKDLGSSSSGVGGVGEEGDDSAFIAQVVGYLNSKAKKAFRPKTEATASAIRARRREGYGLEDFQIVIDNKTADWLHDPKMEPYLCPETLFRPSHFEKYRNQHNAGVSHGAHSQHSSPRQSQAERNARAAREAYADFLPAGGAEGPDD